ncbi:hypothetical protein HUJ05_008703 [Dendroctonus ponderosae]|nr:hypothetical protein HUJ05_008703 [Dendroctonus ponderosae]
MTLRENELSECDFEPRDMNESVPDAEEERDIQDLSDLIANGNISNVPPNGNAVGPATSGMQFRS